MTIKNLFRSCLALTLFAIVIFSGCGRDGNVQLIKEKEPDTIQNNNHGDGNELASEKERRSKRDIIDIEDIVELAERELDEMSNVLYRELDEMSNVLYKEEKVADNGKNNDANQIGLEAGVYIQDLKEFHDTLENIREVLCIDSANNNQ